MPRVSVVIASYNHGKYIGEAIQSVLDQTFQDIEIIITDDGSSDDSVDEINKFSDHRINLFCFTENHGACVAIEKCLNEASGEYIALLNSDDIFLPNKLEKQVHFLDSHPDIGAVFGFAQIINENGFPLADKKNSHHRIFEKPNRTSHEWLNYFFHKGNCLCHPTLLIRKKCYDKIGNYDKRLAQLPDYDFWIRLCMKYDIHILQEPLIKFRIREQKANMSGKRPDSIKRGFFENIFILQHFTQVTNLKELYLIFPEATKYGECIDEELIPFIIALLAINKKSRNKTYKIFGLKVIFKMMGNNDLASKIFSTFNFTYSDFIRMSGEYDIFNHFELQDLRNKLKENSFKSLLKKIFNSK